jgi:hypothetical protein
VIRGDPTSSLKLSIMVVEKSLGKRGVREGFEEVKTLLFEVIAFEVIETIVNSIPPPRIISRFCVSTIIESQTVL